MAGDKRRHVALCSQGPASAVTSLQLIFPLVLSCNYTFGSQEKKEKKKNLGQVVHPLPWGPIPAGQTATSFSPLFPPTAMCHPHFLCSYEIFLCSELINSSRRLLSHQPLHRNSLHKEGGLKTFSRGAGDSFLACHSLGCREGSG